jgi:hypothetical protein
VRFAAKCKAKWCKTQSEMVQNAFFTAPKSLQSRVEWYLILVKISPKAYFLYAKTGFWDDEKW